jgi:hypothetical protein
MKDGTMDNAQNFNIYTRSVLNIHVLPNKIIVMISMTMENNNSNYEQKLAITLPTSGGRPVGIVRSRTHATEIDT